MKNSRIDEKTVNNEVCSKPQKDSVDQKNGDEKPPDSSDDENNTGQADNETQKRIAPLQLMGEVQEYTKLTSNEAKLAFHRKEVNIFLNMVTIS